MLISFLNLPNDVFWNEMMEGLFDSEVESVLGERADKEVFRLSDPNSKIHVVISESPYILSVVSRKAIAKQVFLFLKYHGVLDGSDVFFYGFEEGKFGDRFFVPADVQIG